MNALLFLIFAASTLSAQAAIPQPLGVGEDKLDESTAEYMAQHPNCFLPTESLPTNYKAGYRNTLGEDTFDCQVISVGNDQLHFLRFRLRKKSTVIVNGHVAAIFYDLRRKNFSAIESTLRTRLGRPTEEKFDGYIGHDGCKGKEIHWRNEVSEIVLIDECERHYRAAAVNLFYFGTKPST